MGPLAVAGQCSVVSGGAALTSPPLLETSILRRLQDKAKVLILMKTFGNKNVCVFIVSIWKLKNHMLVEIKINKPFSHFRIYYFFPFRVVEYLKCPHVPDGLLDVRAVQFIAGTRPSARPCPSISVSGALSPWTDTHAPGHCHVMTENRDTCVRFQEVSVKMSFIERKTVLVDWSRRGQSSCTVISQGEHRLSSHRKPDLDSAAF